MAGLVGAELAEHGATEQVDVADRIQDLVDHELVGVAQPVLVEYPVVVEHDGVVHAAAERQVALAQRLDIAQKTERARAAHFLQEGRRRKVDARVLAELVEHRVIEIHLEVHLESVERPKFGPLVAVFDTHRFPDADEFLRRILFLDAGGLQQEHERAGAAVHDRHFRGGQVDDDVVDAEACKCRHQVLDGRNLDAVPDQRRAQHRFADEQRIGRNVDRLVEIDAAEQDAGIFRGRPQRHVHLFAGVQTDAGGANGSLECTLSQHRYSVWPGIRLKT